MKRSWLFIFIIILLISTNAFASRLSVLPNPGVSTLSWHFNRTDSNFIELYRLIFASEPGFTGISGNIITSGIIEAEFISGDIARAASLEEYMRLSFFDNDTDGFIDDAVIPTGIARSAAMTLLLDAKMTRSIYDSDMNNFIDDGVLPATIARTSTVNTALNLKANAADVPTTSAMNTALSGKQNADADLTTFASITPSANTISLLGSANYAAMLNLLNVYAKGDIDTKLETIDNDISYKQSMDADLDDLSDGSLTGSKVGPGINAANVSTGTLPDAVIPSGVTRDTELTTSLGSYTTTSALTTLLAGKMGMATGTPDGTKFLRDDMTWQIISAGGGDDWDAGNDSIIDIGYLPAALIVESELTTTLSNYVLTSALTTALGNYITTGSAASFSSVTTTGPISSTGGADGTRGIWWTNPNTVAETMTQGFGIYPTNTGIHAKWTDTSAVEHDIVIGTGGTGSSVYVDGASVDTPNFDSTGDIDVVATGSNVAANVKDNVLTLDNLTTGSVVTSGETPVSNDTSIMTTASVVNYINAQVDHLVNMKLADADFTIGNYLNPVSSPAAVSDAAYTVSGNVYDNGTTPTVEVSLNSGAYSTATVTGTTSPWGWNRALTLISGSNTIDTRITNSDTEIVQLPQVAVNYTVPDTTDPVVGAVTPSSLTHDGTGVILTATVATITETNEASRQWSLYDVTDAAVQVDWMTFTGLSITGISVPADQHEYRIDVRVTDLAGNIGTASSVGVVYSVVCSGSGTLGYTTVSASVGEAVIMRTEFTLAAPLCVTWGKMRISDFASGEKIRLVVWDSTGTTALAVSNEVSGGVSGLIDFTFPASVQLTAGTYRVGFISLGGVFYYHTATAGTPLMQYVNSYTYPNTDSLTWLIYEYYREIECYVGGD